MYCPRRGHVPPCRHSQLARGVACRECAVLPLVEAITPGVGDCIADHLPGQRGLGPGHRREHPPGRGAPEPAVLVCVPETRPCNMPSRSELHPAIDSNPHPTSMSSHPNIKWSPAHGMSRAECVQNGAKTRSGNFENISQSGSSWGQQSPPDQHELAPKYKVEPSTRHEGGMEPRRARKNSKTC